MVPGDGCLKLSFTCLGYLGHFSEESPAQNLTEVFILFFPVDIMVIVLYCFIPVLMTVCYVYDFSFENSPRHDAFVPKFEAELAQFCEKLVGSS